VIKCNEISVIIPAYNEEKSIQSVVNKILESFSFLEIIVVDDGSIDRTFQVIEGIHGVKVIQHPYNIGYGAALKSGIRKAVGKKVLIIDADGQFNPLEIKKLLPHSEKFDMVNTNEKNEYSLRSIGRFIINHFASFLSGTIILDINSGLRIIERDLCLQYINILPNKFSFTTTMTLIAIHIGRTLKFVPVDVSKRTTGKSMIRPFKDGTNFLFLIVRVISLTSPLRIFFPLFYILFFVGMLLLLYELFLFQNIGNTTIFFFIVAIITLFFGVLTEQISSLMVLGK